MIDRKQATRTVVPSPPQRGRATEPLTRDIPLHLEVQFHEYMREQNALARRIIELLYVPVCYTVPRGNLAANEQSILPSNQGLVLYGVEATKVGGASELRVHVGSNTGGQEVSDINIAAGDPQAGVLRYWPNGIDIEQGVFSEIVAGTMRVNYIVARRAIAVNRSI